MEHEKRKLPRFRVTLLAAPAIGYRVAVVIAAPDRQAAEDWAIDNGDQIFSDREPEEGCDLGWHDFQVVNIEEDGKPSLLATVKCDDEPDYIAD